MLWRALEPALPISFGNELIRVKGREFKGAELSVQALSPHPQYPERKLVLVGGQDAKSVGFSTLELAVDGWFDFALFQKNQGLPTLIQAGHYGDLKP